MFALLDNSLNPVGGFTDDDATYTQTIDGCVAHVGNIWAVPVAPEHDLPGEVTAFQIVTVEEAAYLTGYRLAA